MALKASIDPDGSNHALSDPEDASVVQVVAPSLSHMSDLAYDDWKSISVPEEIKPSDSASRPRSRSRSRPRYRRRRDWQPSPESPVSPDSEDDYPSYHPRRTTAGGEWPPVPPAQDSPYPGPSHIPSPLGQDPRAHSDYNAHYPRGVPPSDQREATGETLDSPQSPDWQLRSGAGDKDITVHLGLEAALDVSPGLEQLSRLNRLGHFKEAVRFFEERLAAHVDFFPVTAEYVDLLLEQGSFGSLERFILNQLDDPSMQYSEDEVRLLKLLKSLAEIHTRGALIPALQMTKETIKIYASEPSETRENQMWSRLSIGIQIQLVEACLRIITYAAAHSTFLYNDSFQSLLGWSFSSPIVLHNPEGSLTTPQHFLADRGPVHRKLSPEDNTPKQNLPRLGNWYYFLVHGGFLWESHRLLRSIVQLLGDSHGQYKADVGFGDLVEPHDDISTASGVFLRHEGFSNDDEQLLLTDLANASLLADFLNVPSRPKDVLTAQGQFSKKAHALAKALVLTHPHLVNSRPYLNWMLLVTGEARWLSNQSLLSVVQSRLISRIFLQDSVRTPTIRASPLEQRDAESSSVPNQHSQFENVTGCSLKLVSATAQDLGDYATQQYTLQSLFQKSHSLEERFQLLRSLKELNQKIMDDAVGYLQCLIEEYLLLEHLDSSNVDSMRMDLHHRLSEFDESFPSRFDNPPEVRRDLDLAFFDIPSLNWLKAKAWYQLRKRMGRNIKTELLTVRLHRIEQHLPEHLSSSLDRTLSTYTGCGYCRGSEEQSPEDLLTNEKVNQAPVSGPQDSDGLNKTSRFPRATPRTITEHRHREVGPGSVNAGDLENHIKQEKEKKA